MNALVAQLHEIINTCLNSYRKEMQEVNDEKRFKNWTPKQIKVFATDKLEYYSRLIYKFTSQFDTEIKIALEVEVSKREIREKEFNKVFIASLVMMGFTQISNTDKVVWQKGL